MNSDVCRQIVWSHFAHYLADYNALLRLRLGCVLVMHLAELLGSTARDELKVHQNWAYQ
jgi:hypothetical protein